MDCDGNCLITDRTALNKTWMCNGKCQDWKFPCNGKCFGKYDSIDCAGECNYETIHRMCGKACIAKEIPCNGECKYGDVACNGNCQSREQQCDGKCLDTFYNYPNCDDTCSLSQKTWMCNSICLKMEQPCNGNCPPGNVMDR